ncbi:MAG: DUF421 domain-containing protein [Chthonomonadales bacterium]
MMHYLLILSHTLAIYIYLIVGLRFVARRQLTQLAATDIVIILLLGSAVETSMIANDTSLAAGLVSAATLIGADWIVTRVTLRRRRLRRFLTGGPLLLVHNGQVLHNNLRQAGMTEDDLLEALREREAASPSDVRFAVMELDGSITVVLRSPHRRHVTPPGGWNSNPSP